MIDSVMDSDHACHKHSDAFTGGELFSSARKSHSISSSSSSLRSSFEGDFFQVDENKHNYVVPIPAQLASKYEDKEDAFPNTGEACQISSWSEQTASGSPPGESDSGSPGSDHALIGDNSNSLGSDRIPNGIHSDSEDSDPGTPGSISTPMSMQEESVLQSPGVQMMERPDDTTAYRIPPHVFERSNSKSPGEWSMASNESLFSIHIGNNSFSKEQFFMMCKSGEFGMSGELGVPYKLDEPLLPTSPQSPVAVIHTGKKSSDIGLEEAAAETMKEVLREAAENQKKPKVQLADGALNKSYSHHSDMSGTSNQSFAFPILTEDAVKKNVSVKVEPEQQPPKDQAHTQSTRVCLTTNWFSWLPPRCRFCC